VEKVEKEAIRIKENLEDYKSFESGDQEHEFYVCLLIDLKNENKLFREINIVLCL
jgi:hypothetical protein